MYESLDLGLSPAAASVVLGLILGALFGALAEITRLCLRRAVAGPPAERLSATGVWLAALTTAMLGTQAAVWAGLISFDGHRFFAADLPWLAITLGGLLFGAGMVLTRGCISRLTVLLGSGNLRALTVIAVFAIVAHATMVGVLASTRVALGSVTIPLGETVSLAALPGGALLWTALIAIAAAAVAWRSDAPRGHLALAAVLGLLVPAAWVGTGYVLQDPFEPIAMENISTTLPMAETLFWAVASTSVAPGFGVGLMGGFLVGALASALLSGRFAWQSFETAGQTGRYVAGGALMGVGGVLAGGCTLGAGLSGIPTLSVAAILGIASIVVGGIVTDRVLGRASHGAAVPAQ